MKKVIALMIICFISFGFASKSKIRREVREEPVKMQNGRFVLKQISDSRKDQFMIDTLTGRVWIMVVNSSGENVLQPVKYKQILGGYAHVPDSEDAVQIDQAVNYRKHFKQIDDSMGD